MKIFKTITSIIAAVLLASPPLHAQVGISGQSVENRISPVGLDAPQPRFSWKLKGSGEGLRQTAYQIQVSSEALVWDSGWIDSDQSHLVRYEGKPLQSSTPYVWKVRIKDGDGKESAWCADSRWVTGLMDAEAELKADWIGYDIPAADTPAAHSFDISGASWICHPDLKEKQALATSYRKTIDFPEDTKRVIVSMELNETGQLIVNGTELLQGGRFGIISYLDISPWIRPGKNAIGFRAYDASFADHPGLIASIYYETATGTTARIVTDEAWESTLNPVDPWATAAQGNVWKPVRVLGKPGDANPFPQGKKTLFSPEDSLKAYSPPAVYLRKEIDLKKPVKFAVFHGTAKGLYDLHLNGQRQTETGFQPGWTQFDKRISYVSTDVTRTVKTGKNVLGAVLADGWYRGNLLWTGREKFGEKLRFSGQLVVEYADGSRETFATDSSWQASYGPIRQSDIMNGEIYDARLEQSGWDAAGFDSSSWAPVASEKRGAQPEVVKMLDVTARVRTQLDGGERITAQSSLVGHDPAPGVRKSLVVQFRSGGKVQKEEIPEPGNWSVPKGLSGADILSARYGDNSVRKDGIQRAHPTEPVAIEQELSPQAITEPKPGIYVIDFGQNFAGWARLKVMGEAGQSIYLRFAEDLNPDGTIYTDNLRSINPADRYVCRGGKLETWEPRFTYHGFRYVQMIGLKEKPSKETLTGIVAHSGGAITSTFDSSSPMLNRLYKNVQWSQRSNYFETMTDCPQRDERYGWVGDAWFFMASSAYNQNGASFFNKWFLDCVDTQITNGNISNGAPRGTPSSDGGYGSQIDWSAAMIVTPWMIWQHYGDAQPIIENYDALRHYMTIWEELLPQITKWEDTAGKKGKRPYNIIGDWVALEQGTTTEFIGRVVGYMLSKKMVGFARIVGNAEDEATFSELAASYRAEVIAKHIKPDGTVDGGTQCAYAYVTNLKLYNPDQEAAIRAKFAARMATDKHGVRTGFHGTGNLLQGLSEIGLVSDAAETVLSEASPGWGAMVRRGATTIWERWEGKNDNGNFFNPHMNSFNHYTFGGCGEWLMGHLVGLRSAEPGFKVIKVEPTVIPGLDRVSGSFETPYGSVSNRWGRKDGRITMQLVVPPNSTAEVSIPENSKNPTYAGRPSERQLTLPSGMHSFEWQE